MLLLICIIYVIRDSRATLRPCQRRRLATGAEGNAAEEDKPGVITELLS
jgi:hypothetical protein